MSFRRRQLLGWAVLAVAALCGGLWLLRVDFAQKISKDVLDLVPTSGSAPELTLVRQLAGEAEARTMLFELTVGGRPAPLEAGREFRERLAGSSAFAEVVLLSDTSAREALGKELFDRRLALLFPRWLQERREVFRQLPPDGRTFGDWLAEDVATSLAAFLTKPEALAAQEIVPADPLLLLPRVVEQLEGGLGLAGARVEADGPVLLWAQLTASPLSEAGQAPAFAAIEASAASVREKFSGLHVAYSGINRFAAASRDRIEREVTWLNAASLIAVLAVAFTFVRRVHRGLHLVPVVLASTLGAWVCTTLAFERVHILVFVFGSLLTGVAIDYGFYLFMQPPARPGEDYPEKVRRLAKPLLASCLTTVAGFALLLGSDLPFIRQLGLFVGSGLVSALAAAVVYFATVRDPFLEARTFRGGAHLEVSTRRRLRLIFGGLWLVALPGLAWLEWRDDIRDLEIPSPELKAEDTRLRHLLGGGVERTVYVTYGQTLADARASLEKLEAFLAGADGERSRPLSLAAVLPTAEEARAAAEFLQEQTDFPETLQRALAAAGFEEGGFEPFFEAYRAQAASSNPADVTPAFAALQARMTGPLGMLVHEGQPLSWFITLAAEPPPAVLPAELHTVTTSQLQSLNQVFAQYRKSALRLSLVGLAIVGLGVLLTYGWRDGVRIFAIPCAACLGLFGLLGWIGQPLNLFHLLGAFLGVCLTHNYSIFSATSAYRHELPPVSVRVSALTAAASFGVLALSGIPVVRALGLTVAAMVVVALLMIEFEHLAGLGRRR